MHLVDDTFFGTNFLKRKYESEDFVYCMNTQSSIQYALKPSSSIQKYFQDLLVMFHVESLSFI